MPLEVIPVDLDTLVGEASLGVLDHTADPVYDLALPLCDREELMLRLARYSNDDVLSQVLDVVHAILPSAQAHYAIDSAAVTQKELDLVFPGTAAGDVGHGAQSVTADQLGRGKGLSPNFWLNAVHVVRWGSTGGIWLYPQLSVLATCANGVVTKYFGVTVGVLLAHSVRELMADHGLRCNVGVDLQGGTLSFAEWRQMVERNQN